jgi:polyhydroxyalkanoate synthase subunit PhaC
MAPSRLDRQLRRLKNGLTYYAGLNRPPIGRTPRDLVWQRDRARLWRYRSTQRRVVPPVLIVHSLVSRSYILDLLPSNSMVGFLVQEGFDVFMLDWESAVPADAENTLETYVDQYLVDAVSAACGHSHADGVTLVGYCFGGVLALLLAASPSNQRVRNLVTLTTPCDFSRMGFMSQMFVEGRLDPEDVIDETGLVPGVVLDQGFQSLKPTDPVVQRVTVWQNLSNDDWLTGFIAMNRWARDQVPFPAAAFRQTVHRLIRDNGLLHGVVPWGADELKLADIRMPYLNVFCRRDEIVPPRAAEPLVKLVGSGDASEVCLESGHVGLVAGRQAAKVSRPKLAGWIASHSDTSGGSPSRASGRATDGDRQPQATS